MGKYTLLIFSLCSILIKVINIQAQDIWRESRFEDFIDGTFDDAGANMYVSAKGNIQTINRWDVNDDGNIDILCVNSHPLVEMLDMSIYWGNGKDFSIQNHSYIPANGPMWVALLVGAVTSVCRGTLWCFLFISSLNTVKLERIQIHG